MPLQLSVNMSIGTPSTRGAEIAANGIYIIAHGSSDPSLLALANETHNYLSNSGDGAALAYGTEDNYVILDPG